jgi:hypothetical protein
MSSDIRFRPSLSRRFRLDISSGGACDEHLQIGQIGKAYEIDSSGRHAWRRHPGVGGVEPLLRQLAAEDVEALEYGFQKTFAIPHRSNQR